MTLQMRELRPCNSLLQCHGKALCEEPLLIEEHLLRRAWPQFQRPTLSSTLTSVHTNLACHLDTFLLPIKQLMTEHKPRKFSLRLSP